MYTEERFTGTEESMNLVSGREAFEALETAMSRNDWDYSEVCIPFPVLRSK